MILFIQSDHVWAFLGGFTCCSWKIRRYSNEVPVPNILIQDKTIPVISCSSRSFVPTLVLVERLASARNKENFRCRCLQVTSDILSLRVEHPLKVGKLETFRDFSMADTQERHHHYVLFVFSCILTVKALIWITRSPSFCGPLLIHFLSSEIPTVKTHFVHPSNFPEPENFGKALGIVNEIIHDINYISIWRNGVFIEYLLSENEIFC